MSNRRNNSPTKAILQVQHHIQSQNHAASLSILIDEGIVNIINLYPPEAAIKAGPMSEKKQGKKLLV
jgi:hypothetical protein